MLTLPSLEDFLTKIMEDDTSLVKFCSVCNPDSLNVTGVFLICWICPPAIIEFFEELKDIDIQYGAI